VLAKDKYRDPSSHLAYARGFSRMTALEGGIFLLGMFLQNGDVV
jgi:hypothetical protein